MARVRVTAVVATAFTLLLASCTQAPVKGDPFVDILSPSEGEVLNQFEAVVLQAVAVDAEDGDLSDAVTWESSRDGELTPDSEGRVNLTPGAHVLTASVTDSSGATDSDEVNVTVETPTNLQVVSSGRTLTIVGLIDDTFSYVDSAEVPAGDYLPTQKVFKAIYHPTEPVLYVSSFDQDWGNARLDRFAVSDHSIDYIGPAFVYDVNLTDVSCTQDSDLDDGIIGGCAPIGMVFSPDAQRLYVDDDNCDCLQIFSVEPDGTLAFIEEGGITSVHGLTIDDTGTYVFNGTNVMDVTGDTVSPVSSGDGGNSTTLVDLDGTPGLITGIATDTIGVYDVTDPTNPVEVTTETVGPNQVREIALDDALERMFTVGRNSVRSFSFDGADIAELDAYAPSALGTEYRDLSLDEADGRLFAAWFNGAGGSGVDALAVAIDGTLTPLDRMEFGDGFGHIVLALRQN